MNITIKTQKEIAIMREGGQILAGVLRDVVSRVGSGIALNELDALAEREIRAAGAEPAFLGYQSSRKDIPYPATLCVSVNDEVVHGIGTRKRMLCAGDIVGLDIGLRYPARTGLYVDMAVSLGVGPMNAKDALLVATACRALEEAIQNIRPGAQTRELSRIIQRICEQKGFSVVRDLTGHGIGKALHEDPPIFCYDDPRLPTVELKEGMVICIEPMVIAGDWRVVLDSDGWTVRSRDKSRAAHFEHTIAVTKDGYEVLTV